MTESRRIRWAEYVAGKSKRRNEYKVLVGKPERKRPLEKPRTRWKNIKMDLKEIELKFMVGFMWLMIGINNWLL
jgi:hypothetical protein